MNENKIFQIAEKVASAFIVSAKSVDIGDGFYIDKVGMDNNGNSSVWMSKGSNKAKKIQINGVITDKSNVMSDKLEYFEDKEDTKVKKTIEELKDHYKKFVK